MYRGRRVIATAFLVVFFLAFSASVQAQYGYGYGQYGAGGAPSIIIDKAVASAGSEKGSSPSFVDNLSPSDSRFAPNQEILFRLTVKNTSDEQIGNVVVTDILPEFLSLIEAQGDFDEGSRTLTIKAGDFKAQEEKEFIVRAQVASQDKLPQDKTLLCLINKGRVNTDTLVDEDTSQFCVEKQVHGVTSQPAAGAPIMPLIVAVEAMLFGAGLVIKRATRSYYS